MNIELDQILHYLDEIGLEYKYVGNKNITINKFSSINNIDSNCISWVKEQSNYIDGTLTGLNNVIIVTKPSVSIIDNEKEIGFILCQDPKEAFFSILGFFFSREGYRDYISPKSVVETKAIGKSVYIGHNCFIGKNVTIDDNVIIKNNVSIEGTVEIGKNTIIHSGVVIGTDGFGYYQDSEGRNIKVPHYGGVIIGQDVEIGANTCIDRGTLDNTVIGDNVKIDNLCHIGHNCVIKYNSLMIALSMLGGSTVIEKDSYIAPGVMIMNQTHIGENSLVGMGAVVVKDVEENTVVAGVPAKVIRKKLRGANK